MTPHPGMMMMDPAGVLIFSPKFSSIFGPRPGNMVPFQNSLFVTILVIIDTDTVPFT